MVPALYQAVFPALNPFWQAFAPQPPAAPERAPVVSRAESAPAQTVAAPQDAAMAMMTFWFGASETATKFWSGPTSPMAMAPRLAAQAQGIVAEAMAPKPQSASWYRAPMGTQDVASGAVGYMAGPFAALLPAFTAAPFWPQMPTAPAARPFGVTPISVPSMNSLWAEQPWARMWMNALAAAAPAPAPMPIAAMMAAFVPPAPVMPAYQSDSGHAVAQIVHTAARVMIAILPLIAMLLAIVSMMPGQPQMLIA